MSRLVRPILSVAVISLFAFVCAASAQNEFQRLTVTDADRYFAGQAQNSHYHVLPTTNPEGRAAAARFNAFTSNIGEVIYSVQPWYDVPGCQMEPGVGPNGQLADGTNYGVGHETIEAITDPIPATAGLTFSIHRFSTRKSPMSAFSFTPGKQGANFTCTTTQALSG